VLKKFAKQSLGPEGYKSLKKKHAVTIINIDSEEEPENETEMTLNIQNKD